MPAESLVAEGRSLIWIKLKNKTIKNFECRTYGSSNMGQNENACAISPKSG